MRSYSPISSRVRIVSTVLAVMTSTLVFSELSALFQQVSTDAVIARQDAAAKALAGTASTRNSNQRIADDAEESGTPAGALIAQR